MTTHGAFSVANRSFSPRFGRLRLLPRTAPRQTFATEAAQSPSPEKPPFDVRDNTFYEFWGAKRVYFYQVDLRGRLYLDLPSLVRRNDATCLKAESFLDFFFQRIRKCPSPSELTDLKPVSWREPIKLFANEYPYISPCGRELNFVKADDTPIVYRDLIQSTTSPAPSSGPTDYLVYGGTLREAFDPSRLVINETTERIYYSRPSDSVPLLLHVHLAERLSKNFSPDGQHWEYNGKQYPLTVVE